MIGFVENQKRASPFFLKVKLEDSQMYYLQRIGLSDKMYRHIV